MLNARLLAAAGQALKALPAPDPEEGKEVRAELRRKFLPA